ncbi:hypothetical protein ACFLT0_00185 [Chloroflexota bacterium]
MMLTLLTSQGTAIPIEMWYIGLSPDCHLSQQSKLLVIIAIIAEESSLKDVEL